MNLSMPDDMTLAELAETSGTAARTIRFYISRGLLDGPVKAGRGAAYTRSHLERLEQIKALQKEGRTLADIAHRLSGHRSQSAVQPSAWWHYPVAEDVVVISRSDVSPWRIRQIRQAIEDFTLRLKEQNP